MKQHKKPKLWLAGLLATFNGGIGLIYVGHFRLAIILLTMTTAIALIMTSIVLAFPFGYAIILAVQITIWIGFIVFALFLARKSDSARPPVKSMILHISAYVIVGVAYMQMTRNITQNYFPYRYFSVPGGAMEPTLFAGDNVAAKRLKSMHEKKNVTPGTIIIFKSTYNSRADRPVNFVKRVIAVGGQRVRITDGIVFVDGLPATLKVEENHSGDIMAEILNNGIKYQVQFSGPGHQALQNSSEVVVPADHYFVLGDNRQKSADSRMTKFGMIPAEDVYGTLTHIAVSFDDFSRMGLSVLPEKVD